MTSLNDLPSLGGKKGPAAAIKKDPLDFDFDDLEDDNDIGGGAQDKYSLAQK